MLAAIMITVMIIITSPSAWVSPYTRPLGKSDLSSKLEEAELWSQLYL